MGDGAGAPVELWPAVLDLLRERADVSLLTGWWLHPPARVEELSAGRAHTVISGFGLRKAIDGGHVGFLPIRLGAMPTLLHGPLRADVLVATLRPTPHGFAFTTEVSWQRAAISAGARVAAVVRKTAPGCAVSDPLGADEVVVLADGDARPHQLASPEPTPDQEAVAERVGALIPSGARLQVGPGGLGAAVYAALRSPVAVDTGLVTDPVVELDRRGLLDGTPVAPYVTGTELVYEWAPGRVAVSGVEHTHDPARLVAGRPLVAVNTGLEIDLDGQVNAETVAGSAVGGIGGQPDYAAAAALSPQGLSVVAMTTRRGGEPTLVERLQGPVTTPSHDVDVVVTERGVADMRGKTRPERREALRRLWDL